MKNCEKILELFKVSDTLVAEHTELLKVDYPDSVYYGFQGGCSDGERYYYQVLMHYDRTDHTKIYSCIAKIDLDEKKVVQYSEPIHLDHGNDITYHPIKKVLYIANNQPNATTITVIDPVTLKVLGYETSPVPLYALEYNEKRDQYAAGICKKYEFCFLDSDFKQINEKTYRTLPCHDRYIKQGICADDNFIYFIIWDGKQRGQDDFQNLVTIYDWDGNYRGKLEFNVESNQEPENISIVNGEMIAVCGKSHPILYHFEPKLKG